MAHTFGKGTASAVPKHAMLSVILRKRDRGGAEGARRRTCFRQFLQKQVLRSRSLRKLSSRYAQDDSSEYVRQHD